MKYAVIEHGGKQFVASEGQVVEVDQLTQQAGSAVEFSQVLLVRENDHVEVGSPYIRGARVKARVAAHVKGPKLLVFKYRPKQRYRVRQGHRQGLTQIEIESIGVRGTEEGAKAKSTAEPKAQAAPRKSAKAKTQRTSTTRKKSEPAAKPAAKPKAKASKAPAKRVPAEKGKPAKKPAAGKKKPAGTKE